MKIDIDSEEYDRMREEYDRLRAAYDPADRCGEPTDEDSACVRSLEVSFAIPVWMTQEQMRRFNELVREITYAPCNQPKEGVHWPAGFGSKPHWSQVDAIMLRKPAEPGAPETGEPTFDDDVYYIETCSREFVSDKERERKLKERLNDVPSQ